MLYIFYVILSLNTLNFGEFKSLRGYYQNIQFGKGKGTQQNDRVVGGHTIQISKVPYLVTIVDTGTKSPFCGGVIVTKKHVLTAAHCIQ